MEPQPAQSPQQAQPAPVPQSAAAAEKPVTKSEYSGVGVIISLMLIITLIVFVQYVIGDLQESYAGKRPQMETYLTFKQGSTPAMYTEKETGREFTYSDGNDYFNKTFVLPYESKRLLVSTFINVPVFILGVLLLFAKTKMRSSYKLGVNAFFAAAVFNMLRLLGELASFAYTVNQKMTMYGVSFVLILVFFGSIIYVQERHGKQTA